MLFNLFQSMQRQAQAQIEMAKPERFLPKVLGPDGKPGTIEEVFKRAFSFNRKVRARSGGGTQPFDFRRPLP